MKLTRIVTPLLFCAVIILSPSFVSFDKTTTIVVVDGKALLVDLNDKGEIITTYMEVPEYFTSEKDHNTKVIEATASYKRLTAEQMDQIRFIALADDGWDLDEFMKSNLADLASHYHQTYANQIEITIAENATSQALLDQNIKTIKDLLVSYGVAKEDINIVSKIDMGEEPTRFIKVVSNLRNLAVN